MWRKSSGVECAAQSSAAQPPVVHQGTERAGRAQGGETHASGGARDDDLLEPTQ